LPPFVPLVRHPHLQTVLAHFWPSGLDERRFPAECLWYETEPGVRVLVKSHRPAGAPLGEVILVHGLEGSSESSYMRSLARAALEGGFAAHRMNLRGCGGTEAHCRTAYHSGLTTELRALLERFASEGRGPVFVVGFSLGGNVALKLAGELGEAGGAWMAGVCAVSTPIDLEASTCRLERPDNRVYEQRFLRRIKRRVRLHAGLKPEFFGDVSGVESVRTIREFDERFTSRWFGFDGASGYYHTQSACRVLDRVRVPVLLLQAKDDPVVPFEIFERPEVRQNPRFELVAPDHGGHVGFLARRPPRFWANAVLLDWIASQR
jgi:predicted alpha/beta-fold hydrolase